MPCHTSNYEVCGFVDSDLFNETIIHMKCPLKLPRCLICYNLKELKR